MLFFLWGEPYLEINKKKKIPDNLASRPSRPLGISMVTVEEATECAVYFLLALGLLKPVTALAPKAWFTLQYFDQTQTSVRVYS